MTHFTKASRALQLSAAAMLITACSNIDTAETAPVQESRAQTAKTDAAVPASQFDLSHWKLTLPTDDDGNAKADSIRVSEFQSYAHPDFFYLDEFDHMVFTAPNKPVDNPIGYTKYGHYFKAGIYNYFKAGIYNSCRAGRKGAESKGRCQWTGDWATDKANGDYFQVSFSRLSVTQPTTP